MPPALVFIYLVLTGEKEEKKGLRERKYGCR
jgi:hypothetical protein